MANNNIQEIILIGRDASCNFIVEDASVSRNHAQIVNYGNYVSVVDLGSSNGTFVNGKRVTSETTLHPGDELKVGNSIVPWDQLVTPSTGGGKKNWIWIIIVAAVLLLAGLGVGAYFLWIRSDLEKTKGEVINGVIKTDSLMDANAQKEQQIQNKENENSDLSNRNSSLKQENDNLSNKNSNLQETNSNLKNANDKLSSEKNQAESELEAARIANKELQRKLDSIEAAKKKEDSKKKVVDDDATKKDEEKKPAPKQSKEQLKNEVLSKILALDTGTANAACDSLQIKEHYNPKKTLREELEKAYEVGDEERMNKIKSAIDKAKQKK